MPISHLLGCGMPILTIEVFDANAIDLWFVYEDGRISMKPN